MSFRAMEGTRIKYIFERVMIMASVAVMKNDNKISYDVKDAMNILLNKLDEAIDDMENGRTLSSEEMWNELEMNY